MTIPALALHHKVDVVTGGGTGVVWMLLTAQSMTGQILRAENGQTL